MKTAVFFSLLLILSILIFPAQSLGSLDEVLKPSIIDIHKGKLFVMDREQVHVYNLKDLTHIASFGKKGEGPGEYKIEVGIPLRLQAFDEYVMVESRDKLSYFSHNGKYLREIRVKPDVLMINSVGEKFIGRKLVQPPDGSHSSSTLFIYDKDFNEVLKLHQQPFLQQGAFPNLRLNLGKDFLLYQVADNKIFVEDSARGFLIDVYDFNGKKLYQIKRDEKMVPVTSSDKTQLLKDLEMDPQIQRQLKAFNFTWKDMSRNFKYEYPKYYPAIKTMTIDQGKIYIKTPRKKDNRGEMLILDLKGKLLKRTFIEPTVKEWVMALMMGVQLDTIYNGKIYYIEENADEEWELFVTDIQ